MLDTWEIIDVYKALMALTAGVILGIERELKDKDAGFKTISVICLGSCLFTILSLKIGDQYTDAGRIASYIVSGIGFIGAGVIFKDKFTVSGLTTASIIWMAAAIGMAIGFGQVYVALIFMIACLLITYASSYLNFKLFTNKTNKILKIVLSSDEVKHKSDLLSAIKPFVHSMDQVNLKSCSGKLTITLDIKIETAKLNDFELFLFKTSMIESFEL